MYFLDSEAWLNRIGFVLVILGVAFALQYMFDQQWFTPLLRVMSGSFRGSIDVGSRAAHLHRDRPRFGQMFLASGIATFYFTAYGAYRIYELVPLRSGFHQYVSHHRALILALPLVETTRVISYSRNVGRAW